MAEIKHTDDPMSPLPHVSNSRFRLAIKKYFYKDIEPEYTQYIEDLIINGSIESLDTLKELAEAIGNDPNFFGDVNARFDEIEEVTSAALNDLNSKKQDKLVSGVNIKTINENSILDEGNLNLVQFDPLTLTDPQKQQARENIGAEKSTDIVVIDLSVSTLNAEVGKYYRFDVPVETLAITLPTMTGVTSVKTITFYMTGGTTPAVTFTSSHSIYYSDGFEIAANSTYEVSAAYNGIAWVVASVKIVIPT